MKQLRILALPRDRNPYQELLYGPMRAAGTDVRYGGELTPSRTLNLLALPLELVYRRVCGYTVLHLHWTFGFRFTGSERSERVRRASRIWFTLSLTAARSLGMRIVWTAHNVLPHDPVFDDDEKARRALIQRADLILAHTHSALNELSRFGEPIRHGRVIAHGPIRARGVAELPPPAAGQRRRILFFGRIAAYKGVEDLLDAVRDLDRPLELLVVGECPDPALRERLTALARTLRGVTLRLEGVPDEMVAPLFGWADAVIFPFRAVTTSGSVQLGLASGRPVIIPDLRAFAELPSTSSLRYEPGVAGLRNALLSVCSLPSATLQEIGAAGRAVAASVDWPEIAECTTDAIRDILRGPSAAGERASGPLSASLSERNEAR